MELNGNSKNKYKTIACLEQYRNTNTNSNSNYNKNIKNKKNNEAGALMVLTNTIYNI